MTWTKRSSLGETQIIFFFLLGKRWHKMQIYHQKKKKKKCKFYLFFLLHFSKKRRKKKMQIRSFFFFYVFLSVFFIYILSLGNSILLILGFVDNILDRHNCYSCKWNTTFFHYLICHIYPQKKCIYLFLKFKNLLKFL